MRSIIRNDMLIYQSKVNLDTKILFGKITCRFDPLIRKTNENSTFHSGV